MNELPPNAGALDEAAAGKATASPGLVPHAPADRSVGEAIVPAAPANPPAAVAPVPAREPAATTAGTTATTAEGAAAPRSSSAGIGVLLVNLGTPDAAEPKAVRRYLKEFLSDPRVIENDSLFWKIMLTGVILPLRSRRKAGDYQ